MFGASGMEIENEFPLKIASELSLIDNTGNFGRLL